MFLRLLISFSRDGISDIASSSLDRVILFYAPVQYLYLALMLLPQFPSAVQIFIITAFSVVPAKDLIFKLLFNSLKKISMSNQRLYISEIVYAVQEKLFVINSNVTSFSLSQTSILLSFSGYFSRVSYTNKSISSSFRISGCLFSGNGLSPYGIYFIISFNITTKFILDLFQLFNYLKSTYPRSATAALPGDIDIL